MHTVHLWPMRPSTSCISVFALGMILYFISSAHPAFPGTLQSCFAISFLTEMCMYVCVCVCVYKLKPTNKQNKQKQ